MKESVKAKDECEDGVDDGGLYLFLLLRHC